MQKHVPPGFICYNALIEMRKLEKPTSRGPTPREKATRALGQRLNRKFKPPPDPSVLFEKRKANVKNDKPV
jgi:hypothetical protein